MGMTEADTRAVLIDPALNRAGWTRSKVTREHYYRPDWAYTAGKVVLKGDKAEREKPKRVDYLLRYTESFPIAVVEAKAEDKPAVSGLQQAIGYARDLGLAFAYATNGHEIIEWDAFTETTRPIDAFPSPEDLWERWRVNMGVDTPEGVSSLGETRPRYSVDRARMRRQNPLLHPYAPPEVTRGKTPRYFQERAIKEVLLRMMRGQKRILLTMATGTGKTFTAFQIVWKLVKSGWLRRRRKDGPGRILFLADRVILRDQAYNAFGPFATGDSDPRFLVDNEKPLSQHRTLYFAIYQTLWTEDERGRRLFEQFPPDFFDLIIIDECHRSGFGTWREILDHFESAVHLGMTATPKQDDNIDTYAYFCAEEPAIPVDPEDPDQGVLHPPAFQYSLGQGIEDGFLATYKIHRIRTNVDKEGLRLEEAREMGAEVIIPEELEAKEAYYTPEFEREITLPDRTRVLVAHLAGMLRRFGPMQKTMVFCVDMNHAREVARLLNNAFADLGLGEDYAVPIVSEEGERARRWLNQFQDSDKSLPVVATTAELLSTGVDVPSARNIVFMKTIASPIVFKQIIGRGTRIDPATDKLWFRIIDYTGATRLLDPRWDMPPSAQPAQPDHRPETATLVGIVQLAETGELLEGASVAVITRPNEQRGPILTDEEGRFRFERLPAGKVTVVASGPGLVRRELKVTLASDEIREMVIELKPAGKKTGKIVVKGLEVTIADEATFIVEGMHEPMTLEQYLDYTRQKVAGFVPDWSKLRAIWADPEQRRVFLEQLENASVHVEVLAEVLDAAEADQFDLLAHLAYGKPLRSRHERAEAFRQREQTWLEAQTQEAREVLLALIDKYELGGLKEMTDPKVYRVSPFREMGEVRGVLRRFGNDPQRLRQALVELQKRLYAA